MRKLLSVSDAARICRVVPDTIRVWERKGWLRAERTEGGIRLFRRRDVERLAAERTKQRANVPHRHGDLNEPP